MTKNSIHNRQVFVSLIRIEPKFISDPPSTTSPSPPQRTTQTEQPNPNFPIIQQEIEKNVTNCAIDLVEVRELVKLLDIKRSKTYESWIEVGLCLHNIDNSLLDSWVAFSCQSSKFKESECEEQWLKMGNFVR